jgi:hypothetical protein
MQTYCDVVVVDKLVEVEGARTLQLMYYGGLPYAVSKSIQIGDVVAVFTPDSQISEEFAKANDLIGYTDPVTGEKRGGFFAKNRKVRSISLMGGKLRSVGFVASQKEFDYLGIDLRDLVGQSFNELNGHKVCNKYVLTGPNGKPVGVSKTVKSVKDEVKTVGMPEHQDTKMFYKFANTLEVGDLITITLKLDGTSVRVSQAWQVRQNMKWYEKLINRFVPIKMVTDTLKVGTRRVVLKDSTNTYYGDKKIYTEVGEKLRGLLHPGEAVYGEIVGWQNESKPLFVRGGMPFVYGTKPGERAFYVYNIKQSLPDGTSYDLPWSQIKRRCFELGVKHVMEMESQFVYDGDLEKLERTVYGLVDGPDPIDQSHIREGVVLRVERANGTLDFFKAKSEAFYALEDKSKNDGVQDIEEQQEQEIEL